MPARGADRTGGAVPDAGAACHVYGPVPGRRLGRSLGVDLVPVKSCPYDCIYCQLGPTRRLTVRRQTFAPVASIVDEVRRALDRKAPPDAITLAGSGEPTLYRPLGALITALKALRTEYAGPIWLEVMVVAHRTDRGLRLQRRLLDLLARRPCPLDDAVAGLSAAPNAVVRALTGPQTAGPARQKRQGPQSYLVAASERALP